MKYYRLLEDSFIGNSIKAAGRIVAYDDLPGANMVETTEAEYQAQADAAVQDHSYVHPVTGRV